MLDILTSKEMKQADENTITHFGVAGNVLMERAAVEVVRVLEEKLKLNDIITVLCGVGNNGGDGFAVARILHLKGYVVNIFCVGDEKRYSKDALAQKQICQKYNLNFVSTLDEIEKSNVLIDAIFGIGLTRDLEGEYVDVIAFMNESKAYKISIDIPSGISADDGMVKGIAFCADLTITFNFLKMGHLLLPGKKYCGEVRVVDIGITKESLLDYKVKHKSLEDEDLNSIPKLKMDCHKGSCGKVLCIAGSEKFAGAAYLCSESAIVSGAGMVQVYTHSSNRDIVLGHLPEALVTCYEKFQENELISLLQWADVIVLGPGLNQTSVSEKLVSYTLKNASVPIVLDADALNIIAKHMEWLKNPHTDIVITPHMAEMSRLTNNPLTYVKEHGVELAEEFSREYQVICVLKDAVTLTAVPYGNCYLNQSGNPGMATAGSGDVLSGVIGSLIAQGLPVEQAAALGVYLHGKAGDVASRNNSMRSMKASDIIYSLKDIYRERGL